MISKLNMDRGRAIVALKNAGKTYEEIASVLNITRQRVEQVHKAFIKAVNLPIDNRPEGGVK